MSKIFKVTDKLFEIVQAVAIILLCAMITLFFVQTMMRYALNHSLSWAEECCRYLFIWSAFLEGGIGISKGIHVGFDLLANTLKGKANTILYVFAQLVVLFLSIVLFKDGIKLAAQVKLQISASMHLPMWMIYAAVPTGAFFSILYSAVNILKRGVKN